MTPPHVEDITTDHTADVEAIRRVIADAESAFNAGDAEFLVTHLAANVTAVGVTGARAVGRDAVRDAARTAFDGPLRDQRARYEIAEVVFVRPDVALVHSDARAVDPSGAAIDVGHTMAALWVLVKDGPDWWVVGRQNTLVTGG